MRMNEENKIILYQDDNEITRVSVRFADEDLWLTQSQLAEIYDTSQQNISQHIDNIYKDGELIAEATNKKFLLVRQEGNRQVKRNIDHYNLDMIIALGYRVQSLIRIIFCRLPLDYNSWWYHSSRRELPNMVTLFLCRHLLVGRAKDVSMDYLW